MIKLVFGTSHLAPFNQLVVNAGVAHYRLMNIAAISTWQQLETDQIIRGDS